MKLHALQYFVKYNVSIDVCPVKIFHILQYSVKYNVDINIEPAEKIIVRNEQELFFNSGFFDFYCSNMTNSCVYFSTISPNESCMSHNIPPKYSVDVSVADIHTSQYYTKFNVAANLASSIVVDNNNNDNEFLSEEKFLANNFCNFSFVILTQPLVILMAIH